ncbi:uncharacterized protein LOC112905760 [Agrilus planipennis]|nr:uncharacterized protein LOC112905760 [Agrilus planipennis]
MKLVGTIAFACVYLNVIVNAGPIPKYIHLCKRNDPEVGKCVRASIEVLRPHLKSGIPELGVPTLEPFHIPKIDIIRGQNSNNFRAGLSNIDVFGASDFQIKKLK